jgi:predicted nucleotidyltransferase
VIDVPALARRLAAIGGVEAVALGGSRARGSERPDSDWDIGLYYRGRLDVDAVRSLGYDGHIAELGDWGRLMNGGAWLLIDGEAVDLLYRDLAVVEHWIEQAEAGRFEVDALPGYVVGIATYVLAGEVALNRPLAGRLPAVAYPERLRESAPPWWLANAAFSLTYAESVAARGDVTGCAAQLARAVVAVAHARLAGRGEWALNDKGIAARAGLAGAGIVLSTLGTTPAQLGRAVAEVRALLDLPRVPGRQADAVAPPTPQRAR